jgi:hypothetical protein
MELSRYMRQIFNVAQLTIQRRRELAGYVANTACWIYVFNAPTDAELSIATSNTLLGSSRRTQQLSMSECDMAKVVRGEWLEVMGC